MITDLADIISGTHRWLRYEQPFPHVLASNVFRPQVFQAMEDEFRGLLARGLSDEPMGNDTMFSRAMGSYDAYGYNFSQDRAGAFDVLLTPAWCRLLAELFDVKATHHVDFGLHHHLPGSRSGWPHTDLAPGWFADDPPRPDCYTLADHSLVNYQTGRSARRAVPGVTEEVRAVAALIYLANDEWHCGDGGETALFGGAGGDRALPAKKVPPINNSVLIFECTPFSFHTFLSNGRSPRNSLIMWLHRSKNEVMHRWDDRSITYWSKGGG
jgi:hypothetical protein